MINPVAKIIQDYGDRERWVFGEDERKITTNGCFDIMTIAHVRLLYQAKSLGGRLIVLINTDESVTRLKGAGRPIMPFSQRAEMVASLACVDFVVGFDDDTPDEALRAIQPAIHVKGGDHNWEDIRERAVVEELGGMCVLMVPWFDTKTGGKISSTEILRKIALDKADQMSHTQDYKKMPGTGDK